MSDRPSDTHRCSRGWPAAIGGPAEFQRLTDQHRRELQVHCYRLLGSLHDAEDLVQETLLAAWTGLERFEGRSSLRSWLYRIATNRCLNALRDAKRRPPVLQAPFATPEPSRLGEATWLEPYPDTLLNGIPDRAPGPDARYEMREAIGLAFIVALQELPPRQRAALVLRDVLGYRASEVADILSSSEESVKAALKRARQTIGERPSDQAPTTGSAEEMALVSAFANAFEADDIDRVVALLADDASISMPPSPLEYHGPHAIGQFLHDAAAWRGAHRQSLLPTRANRQPAFGCYVRKPDAERAVAAGMVVLTLRGSSIAAITRFLDNTINARFNLPPDSELWRLELRLHRGGQIPPAQHDPAAHSARPGRHADMAGIDNATYMLEHRDMSAFELGGGIVHRTYSA
jgi:RNA polymerase sigma-70 factor (TIGR02960 family)